mmetsp:Transcript_5611/g.10665  ORF Transcript_5611/g.10665 Transcript_5611/m.10665 type:complete len:145 (-) Transcript_5611:274-708(-)
MSAVGHFESTSANFSSNTLSYLPLTCCYPLFPDHQHVPTKGVGDTFGTCFGPLSRNRKFGYRLGQGETMEEILASTTEVAEGVDTAIALRAMIKKRLKGYRLDLKYPILFGVAEILEGDQTPMNGMKGLMNMPMRKEAFERYSD